MNATLQYTMHNTQIINFRFTRLIMLPLTPLLLLTACDNKNSPPASPGLPGEVSASSQTEGVSSPPQRPRANNLLQNPSLESTTPAPWYDMSNRSASWQPLEISTDHSFTGNQSAKLTIPDDSPTPTAILGIVQTITPTTQRLPTTLPTRIAGHYKVTDWHRATTNQYLQLVVMAARPSNKPAGTNFPTYQLAIPLAGITEPPFTMGNRKFAFAPHNTPPAEPTLDEWIPFEFNLHDLYKHHWGFIPENSTEFIVFFEVRYDKKADHEHPAAVVYFDDLYFGTP